MKKDAKSPILTSNRVKGINMNNLVELAKKSPKDTNVLMGLHMIDTKIKVFVKDILNDLNADASIYYIKTEMLNQVYILYLWRSDLNATIGVTWLIPDFLDKCQKKDIEMELNTKVRKAVLWFTHGKLDNKKLKIGNNKINWIGVDIIC